MIKKANAGPSTPCSPVPQKLRAENLGEHYAQDDKSVEWLVVAEADPSRLKAARDDNSLPRIKPLVMTREVRPVSQ